MTSQVRSSQNVRFFGLGGIGEHNFDVKRKESRLIGMASVTDICKYHSLCFETINRSRSSQVTR